MAAGSGDEAMWQRLGHPPPADLAATRLELHYAVQVVAAFGETVLPARPDDSHASMTWLGPIGALVGESSDAFPYRVAVRVADLEVLILNGEDRIVASSSIEGWTLDEAQRWVQRQASRFLGRQMQTLRRPGYALPPHCIEDGDRFGSPPREPLAELGRWFANFDRLLRALAAHDDNASPVRCWPHHFDLATRILLDPHIDPERAPQIGIGMSPGDEQYSQPYVYVTPWPHAEHPTLPELSGGGTWNRNGWLGAVLHGQTLVEATTAAEQSRRATAFIESALDAARQVVSAA